MRIMLDIPVRLSDAIFALTDKAVDEYEKIHIFAISTDSRECEVGDLFFSLATDGEARIKYALDAKERGAYTVCESVGFISVDNTEVALLRFAAFYKSRLPMLKHVVGITGSVGKSTVTRYTANLLSASHRVASTIGNFNNRIGISLSVLLAKRDTEVLVLEIGMNHRGEIAEMAELIRPNICVITGIGTAHIGNLGSREGIAAAKLEIITDAAESVIVPFGEPLLERVINRLDISLSDSRASIFAEENTDGYTIRTKERKIGGLRPGVREEHNLYNLLNAAAVAISVGMSDCEIRTGINTLSDGFARGHIISHGNLTVIDDSYNSSPEAAEAMLTLLMKFPAPRIALLSDMLELGNMANELHYLLGKAAAPLDGLYLVGEYADYIALGAVDGGMSAEQIRILRSNDKKRIADILINEVADGTVLIKGSHATGMCDVAKIICDRMRKE